MASDAHMSAIAPSRAHPSPPTGMEGSEMAIDALVVATAIRFGGGIVVTLDPDDIRLLAAGQPSVSIFPG